MFQYLKNHSPLYEEHMPTKSDPSTSQSSCVQLKQVLIAHVFSSIHLTNARKYRRKPILPKGDQCDYQALPNGLFLPAWQTCGPAGWLSLTWVWPSISSENFELNTQWALVTTWCKAHERSASRRTWTTDDALNTIKVLELNGWIWLQCFRHRLHLLLVGMFRLFFIELNVAYLGEKWEIWTVP